jgi:hypothetical protein
MAIVSLPVKEVGIGSLRANVSDVALVPRGELKTYHSVSPIAICRGRVLCGLGFQSRGFLIMC